jgi:hypothetical protein
VSESRCVKPGGHTPRMPAILIVLRDKFERAREAGADAKRAEVATVGGQNSVHFSALGESRDRAVDQPEIEVFELGIELQSPNEIGGKRQLVLVPRTGVEDLSDQFAHCGPLISEEVVNFG